MTLSTLKESFSTGHQGNGVRSKTSSKLEPSREMVEAFSIHLFVHRRSIRRKLGDHRLCKTRLTITPTLARDLTDVTVRAFLRVVRSYVHTHSTYVQCMRYVRVQHNRYTRKERATCGNLLTNPLSCTYLNSSRYERSCLRCSTKVGPFYFSYSFFSFPFSLLLLFTNFISPSESFDERSRRYVRGV